MADYTTLYRKKGIFGRFISFAGRVFLGRTSSERRPVGPLRAALLMTQALRALGRNKPALKEPFGALEPGGVPRLGTHAQLAARHFSNR